MAQPAKQYQDVNSRRTCALYILVWGGLWLKTLL